MGVTRSGALRLTFDRRLALGFHCAKISSDAGLHAHREVDEVLGLTVMSQGPLNDSRTGNYTQHSLVASIRQSIYMADLPGPEHISAHSPRPVP